MRIDIKKLEGRDHLVTPMVLIVEGVWNGSGGKLFYPAEELRRSVPLWNGRPIVVYHPALDTSGIAGNPLIFNRQRVGVIFNARFQNGALKAEAWLDTERLKKVDERVLDSVHNRQMMEVSTGLFADHEEKPGTFNGEHYDIIATNYKPDHLAVLPDLVGACSIADGAGLLRNIRIGETVLLMPETVLR